MTSKGQATTANDRWMPACAGMTNVLDPGFRRDKAGSYPTLMNLRISAFTMSAWVVIIPWGKSV